MPVSGWVCPFARVCPPPSSSAFTGLAADILDKDMQELVKRSGMSPGRGSRGDFGAFMVEQQKKWTQIIGANNITTG